MSELEKILTSGLTTGEILERLESVMEARNLKRQMAYIRQLERIRAEIQKLSTIKETI